MKLKAISKKCIIMVFILIVFVTYLFNANYLFTYIVRVENESTQVEIQLPETQNDFKFSLDYIASIKADWKNMIEIIGWGFKDDVNRDDYDLFVVLISNTTYYVFDTISDERSDVHVFFDADPAFNLKNSGFRALIALESIPDGNYLTGVLLRNRFSSQLYFNLNPTTHSMYKSGTSVVFPFDGSYFIHIDSESSQIDVEIPDSLYNLRFSLEKVVYARTDSNDILMVTGWGFRDGYNRHDYDLFVVLMSDSVFYVFDTFPEDRQDIQEYFNGDPSYNLSNSGFRAYIPLDAVPDDIYRTGIALRNRASNEIFFNLNLSYDYLLIDGSSVSFPYVGG